MNFKRGKKILTVILLAAFILLGCLYFFLNTEKGQNILLPYVTNRLSESLGTQISATHIDFLPFYSLVLSDITIEDDVGQPLIQAKKLRLGFSVFSIWSKKMYIDECTISGASISIKSNDNSTNYDHILENLSGPKPQNTSSGYNASWDILLSRVHLRNTNISFFSPDISTNINVKHGDISIKENRIQNNSIKLSSVIFNGIEVNINRKNLQKSTSASPFFPVISPDIEIDMLDVQDGVFTYFESPVKPTKGKINFQDLALSFSGSFRNLKVGESIAATIQKMAVKDKSGFTINSTGNIEFTNNLLRLDDLKMMTKNSSIDFSMTSRYKDVDQWMSNFPDSGMRGNIRKAKISMEDLRYFLNDATLKTINLHGKKNVNFSGKIFTNNAGYHFKQSKLDIDRTIHYTGDLHILNNGIVDISNGKILTSYKEINKIFPEIHLDNYLTDFGQIEGMISGRIGPHQSHLRHIDLTTSTGMTLTGDGTIEYPSNNSDLYFDLNLKNATLLPEKDLSANLTLPDEIFKMGRISYIGKIKGTTEKIKVSGYAKTDIGNVDIDVLGVTINSKNQYTGNIGFEDFDIGNLTGKEEISRITGRSKFKLDIADEDFNLWVDGGASTFYYKEKKYQNIVIKGDITKKNFKGDIGIDDPEVAMNGTGIIDFGSKEILVQMTGEVDHIDLKEQGITDQPYIISGKIENNLKGEFPNGLTGVIEVADFVIDDGAKSIHTKDKITLFTTNKGGRKKYQLTSPYIDAQAETNIKTEELWQVMKEYIIRHLPSYEGTQPVTTVDSTHYLKIYAKTKEINPLLQFFTNENTFIGDAILKLDNEGGFDHLQGELRVDSMGYDGYQAEAMAIELNGDPDEITADISIKNIQKEDNLIIPEAVLFSTTNNDAASFYLQLLDSKRKPKLRTGGELIKIEEYEFQFHDTLYMNGQAWTFDPDHRIYYGENGLFLEGIFLKKDDQIISLYSDLTETQAIEVVFNNFKLSELTTILDDNRNFYNAIIEGHVTINDIFGNPFITSDLELKDFVIDDTKIGNIVLSAIQDRTKNEVLAEVKINTKNGQSLGKLKYKIATGEIDGEINMHKLRINALDPYLGEIIKNSDGTISGKVNLEGTLSKILVDGKIKIDSIVTTPVLTNVRYLLKDEEITINNNSIDLHNMDLYDEQGNVASMSGKLYHQYLKNIVTDLHITTNRFKVLQTTAKDNDIYYGNITISGKLDATGPIEKIKVDGAVDAIDHSDLTISPLGISGSEEIGEDYIFLNPNEVKKDTVTTIQDLLPVDVEVKININNDSKFNFIVDPLSGDQLEAYGHSNLIFMLHPDASIELFGDYNVDRGYYDFSFAVWERKFKIIPGGTVIFNGDPLDARLNVKSVYATNAKAFPLLKDANLSPRQKEAAKRKLPIEVVLTLKGSILKPQTDIDIKIRENINSPIANIMETKLQTLRSDKDEMVKQVFGILIFNSFSSIEKQGIDVVDKTSDLAIGSLSNLISKQLNKAAGSLLKGIDVDVDLDSYRTVGDEKSGIITDLKLGFSKKLFDERLSIKAGTNINVQGNTSDFKFKSIAGDFLVEYKLTKDGTYLLKAFRTSNFESLLDENTSKNGVGIVIKKEFGIIRRKKLIESEK